MFTEGLSVHVTIALRTYLGQNPTFVCNIFLGAHVFINRNPFALAVLFMFFSLPVTYIEYVCMYVCIMSRINKQTYKQAKS